ncbi:MAG: AarF/ABC1/UbiB kinase family protein [Planctomycetota bacterium]
MSIFSLYRKQKNLRRLQRILTVFAKHGLGHLMSRFRRYLPWRWFLRGSKEDELVSLGDLSAVAKRLAAAMQELGPTFVKLGQMLSSRPDLIPIEFTTEFRKLQDRVEPFASSVAFNIIEQELGKPIGEVFEEIAEQPFAAGSLAQVYTATLRGGEVVVVKVKRPGVYEKLREDTSLMRDLAELIVRHVAEWRALQPQMVVDEFERTVMRELDFVNEASNTARFHEEYEGNERILTPRVHWQYTANRVLVMQRITGENISDFERLDRLGIDRRELARTLAEAFLHQFFESGFFHADPHPGNILVDDEGRIGLVDFGMVGHVDENMRGQLARTLVAVPKRDLETILEVYSDLGVIPIRANVEELRPDLQRIIDKYYGMPLRLIDTKQVMNEVLAVTRRYQIRLPRDFVLLGKAFATAMGLAQSLDPEINLGEVIRPYARKLIVGRLSPERATRAAGSVLRQIKDLALTAPRSIQGILRRAARGEFEMQMRHTGLEEHVRELDRIGNRLAFSIITAAIIISSGMILAAKIRPTVFEDISILGIIGYMVAGIFGLRLLIAIARGGRL